MPAIVVCVEDYGIAHGVCDAALDLLAMGRVSAIAARPGGAAFATRAAELAALERSVGVGLSLDLGETPARLSLAALAGRLDRERLRARVLRDLDAFAAAVGRPPDFVGAPGEAHTLPGLRGALLEALAARDLAGRLWLRDPGGLLARGFRRAASAGGYETNRGYAAFPRRGRDRPVPATYERLVQRLGPAPLLVGTPAYRDATLDALGPRAEIRERELFYLSSERFADLMEVMAWRLVPAPAAHSP